MLLLHSFYSEIINTKHFYHTLDQKTQLILRTRHFISSQQGILTYVNV